MVWFSRRGLAFSPMAQAISHRTLCLRVAKRISSFVSVCCLFGSKPVEQQAGGMALQMKPYGWSTSPSLSFKRSLISPLSSSDVSFQPPPQQQHKVSRLKVVAVVKKSPKRLKYASPGLPKEDGMLYIEVDPDGSDTWKLDSAVELLKKGAVGVIPTDTVYAMVCDMTNHDAIERLRRLKEPYSILCRSLHDIDTYTTGFPRGNSDGLSDYFRAVKHCLPGPVGVTVLNMGRYTFILTASKALPKQCVKYGTAVSRYASRKSVGVRIPDDAVCQAVLEKMGAPLITTSVRSPKQDQWIIDPVLIADTYGPEGLNFVIDAGVRVANPSTVVDMLHIPPKIIRQGKGPKQPWMEEEDDVAAEK
ncbi:DHBP synthase RibB-like alpha/beta domain-containing protein [Tanacetum coccineum]|uniref:Threonylcarbamoyl-AMP synthase n=1 Tax=Tanacetum coccineum TaxID=301880 RepID=A0ABQ4WQB7_9ASTR